MPVQKGNTISVPSASLGDTQVMIQWQQNWLSKNERYYAATYVNKSDGSSQEGLFFVQASKLDELKAKSSGDAYTFVVDEAFQYGQKNREGEGRFLVYHNKDGKMYQHRFIMSVYSTQNAELKEKAKGIYGQDSLAQAQMHFADPLFNF